MQILVNNDFNSAGVQFTQAQINTFLQDEQTAINLLTATFTNNITLTFNVGFGSYGGQTLANQNTAVAAVNTNNATFLTYSQLRTALLTSGQPNFFTGANLPAGDSINGIRITVVQKPWLRKRRSISQASAKPMVVCSSSVQSTKCAVACIAAQTSGSCRIET